MQSFARHRTINPAAIVPGVLASGGTLLVRWLDALDEEHPEVVEISAVTTENHLLGLAKEPVNHFKQIMRINASESVRASQASKIKSLDQLSQSGKRLARRETPVGWER
jgi:hypothetical protein